MKDVDPELPLDAVFGPIYFRLLLRHAPSTQQYSDVLVSQVLRGFQRGKDAAQS